MKTKTLLIALLLACLPTYAAEAPPAKFVMFLMLQTGAAPVTPEHWMLASAEFDDLRACEAALNWFAKNATRVRPNGVCLPKASKPVETAPAPVEKAKE